ncbi:hypothetical protein VTL71DRAFT_2804 [Oculimacula yallundae]|uniref:Actin-like ATPase domain-containing protein n=1 Tax=Oculimacula yallundae TaxID=86028 RepID=A0ABR4CAP0_9HELO
MRRLPNSIPQNLRPAGVSSAMNLLKELKLSDFESDQNSIQDKFEYESEDQLVIALDFGTTFSGIAYAFKKQDKPDLLSVQDWPGLHGRTQPKIPTVICYDPSDNGIFTWGAQTHVGTPVHGIKLLLDPVQPRPSYLPGNTTKADIKRLEKAPVDVAADFIRAMYEHAITKITSTMPAEYIEMCQKQFVLSVPAVWSDKAKDMTIKAAKKAGIYPVTLIKEPEAAAMYVLHMMKDFSLAVGDAFVVCDAGGGTVDLISYEITQLNPRLELKELVPGTGNMSGSLGLNKRFEESVKDLVGEDVFFQLRKSKGFRLAVEYFDQSVKTSYRGEVDEEYLVNFPMANLADDEERHLSSNCWTMNGDDVKTIFDPLIRDIEKLVAEQVQLVTIKRLNDGHPKATQIKAIFLVGGFGSSGFLRNRLQAEHPDIQVVQPPDAWAAIVKGAVLSKFSQEALITSNQATRHYGVEARSLYDTFRDAGQTRLNNPSIGKDEVQKMTWFIERGDDIERDQTIRFPFYRRLPEGFSPSSLVFYDTLYQNESKTAPTHRWRSETKSNCSLKADLTNVDRNIFPRFMGVDNIVYYDVTYDLAITMKSAVMKFSLEMGGIEMGTVDAEY